MEPIVQSAVFKLKELGNNMRTHDRKFNEDDIENIDRVAECLQELETEVKKIHEQFESETIVASVLRHKYMFFPDEIKAEAQVSIKAARDSNVTVINRLKTDLNDILKSIEDGNKRDETLTKEISRLQPEKEIVLVKHEDVISSLNQRLTEKAECQIKLNEIRDALEETKQSTIDLEEDILVLREQLVIDRANARDEKIQLEDDRIETLGLALLQESKNEDKSKEVNRILESLKASEERLKVLYRENERLEATIDELDKSIADGEKSLTDERNRLDSLRLQNSQLIATDKEMIKNYNDAKNALVDQTRHINENKEPLERLKRLKAEEDSLRDEVKDVYDRYKAVKVEVDGLNRFVDELKVQIATQFKEMSSVDSKNKEAYDGLSNLEETHTAIMETLTKELEEYRAQLSDEREYKLRKQNERMTKLGEIQAFQTEAQAEQATGQKYLSYGKGRFSELSRRMDEIEKYMIQNESLAKQLESEEESLKVNLVKIKAKLEDEANQLENELNVIQNELRSVSEEMNALKPPYEELIKLHEHKLKENESGKKKVYESLGITNVQRHCPALLQDPNDQWRSYRSYHDQGCRSDIVKNTKPLTNFDWDLSICLFYKAKKKEKIALIEYIKETKEKTVEHENSRKMVALGIAAKREESLNKIKKHNVEIKSLENEILDTGMRLDNLLEENDKFEIAIKQYEDEIAEIKSRENYSEQSKEDRNAEYHMLQEDLEYGFKSDAVLEGFFEENDIDLINKLTALLDKTKTRETKVHVISDKISKGLGDLTTYLEALLGSNEKLGVIQPYNPLTAKPTQTVKHQESYSISSEVESSVFEGFSVASQCGTVVKQ